MNITTEIDKPIIAIVHFKNEEPIEAAGGRIIFYQVTLYPTTADRSQLSPSGEFIRFGDVAGDEIHGWQTAANIVMDEVLFEYTGAVPHVDRIVVEGNAPDTITVEDVVNG